MDKVCKNCKHGNWGAELPKVCSSCNEGEFWEPKEAMDIWKEAPEGAEYYHENLDMFYKLSNFRAQFYSASDKKWKDSSVKQSLIEGGLTSGSLIKRPQAEQPVYETEAAKSDRELGKELKVYPVAEEGPKEWTDGLPLVGESVKITEHKDPTSRISDFYGKEVTVLSVFKLDDGVAAFAFSHPIMGLGCATTIAIQSQAEKEREEFKARLKQWVDANVWDGEDRKGCKGDSASFGPDDLQELFDDALDFIVESGMAKRLADKGDV